MQRWKLAALAALAAAGGLGAAVVWYSRRWIAPPRVLFDAPQEEHVEAAAFATADGVPLVGWLLRGRPDRPALVLCHGYQRSMEEPFSLAVELRDRGFSVLLFDFRGCGRSGGRFTTIGDFEPQDVLAAVAWLRGRLGPTVPIGVHGISMGGAIAISAVALCPEVAAVVTDSAFAHLTGAVQHRFDSLRGVNLQMHKLTMRVAERMTGGRVARVRPVDLVARIAPRPLLLIHGTNDGIVPYAHALELYAAAGEPKELWTLPGAMHAMARFHAPDEYVERVAAFFTRALAPEREAVAAG